MLRVTNTQGQNSNARLSDFFSLDQIVNYGILSLEGNLESGLNLDHLF